MFGLIKSATRKTAIKTLTSATEDAMESLFSNMEGTDALLSRLGVDRQQALDAVAGGDEGAVGVEGPDGRSGRRQCAGAAPGYRLRAPQAPHRKAVRRHRAGLPGQFPLDEQP